MAKFELTNDEAKQIQSILANATVRVSEAPIILKLIDKLKQPSKSKE